MLQRTYRLPFYIRFSHPRTIQSSLFTLRIQENGLAHNRYAVITGKAIDKRATARNRIKRQIRSCIESFTPQLKTGYDMLFIAKKEAKEKFTQELCEEVEKAYKSLSLL